MILIFQMKYLINSKNMKKEIQKIGKVVLIVFTVVFFTACTNKINEKEVKNSDLTNQNQANELNNQLMEAIQSARESEKKVDLKLEIDNENEKEISINIVLLNPEGAQINSVRSFLVYNSESLEGKEIIFPEDSPFNLIAPGENEFDDTNGIVKIGVSTSTNSIENKEMIIAKVNFSRLNNNFTTVDFYDPREGGHTQVLGIYREHLKNILNEPEVPSLIIESIQEIE